MTTTNAQPIAQAQNVQSSVIVNATGAVTAGAGETSSGTPTNSVLAFTAGASGSRILAIVCSNDDAANAHMVNLFRYDLTNSWFLWAVNVPVSSGYASGVPNVDLLGSPIVGLPIDATNKPIFALKAGEKLYVGAPVAVTSGKNLAITVFGEDF
jgi:hypothetical protein